MDITHFATYSTRRHQAGSDMQAILHAATIAALPTRIHTFVRSNATHVWIGDAQHTPARVILLAVGKAAPAMADVAATQLGHHLSHGLVIYKDDDGSPRHPQLTYIAAGHPVPDARSVHAGRQARLLVENTTAKDLILVLISGGGSALMVDLPDDVPLDDMQHLTRILLGCGADISEINTIRRRIDRIKGGGLAHAAGTTPMHTLVLSDVLGNTLATIASGPTIPNPDTPDAAWQVVDHYGISDQLTPALITALTVPMATPAHASPVHIIGDITQSIQAAITTAQVMGYTTSVIDTALTGDARTVGQQLGTIIATYHAVDTPHCIIAGGETTVTLTGNGKGGRNQEIALAAAQFISGYDNIILAAYATDGGDGPTDAAGAVATGTTMYRAQQLGLNLATTLDRNNTYAWWSALGDLLMPGPTGTNVNDLFVALIIPKPR
ncbi:MAG: glycerate kinase type-2 family protein [Roseiflexaceae bacterium]